MKYLKSRKQYVDIASRWRRDLMESLEEDNKELLRRINEFIVIGLERGSQWIYVFVGDDEVAGGIEGLRMVLRSRCLAWTETAGSDNTQFAIDLSDMLEEARDKALKEWKESKE